MEDQIKFPVGANPDGSNPTPPVDGIGADNNPNPNPNPDAKLDADGKPIIPPVDGDGAKPTDGDPKPPTSDDPKPPVEGDDKETEVLIDDKTYKLDENGNALNEDGSLFKSKEELAELEAVDDDPENENVVLDVIKNANIVITDDTGAEIQYEPTQEGLVKYVQDSYKKGGTDLAQQMVDSYFNRFPVLNNVIRHLELNNSLEGFVNRPSYKNITLDEGNPIQLKNIITEARKARGDSEESIAYFVNAVEKDNKLFDMAKTEHDYLKNAESKFEKEQNQAIAAKQQAEQDAENQYWGEVKQTLQAGKLEVDGKSYKIPDIIKVKQSDGKFKNATKEDFASYIYDEIPVKVNGKTVHMTRNELDIRKEAESRGTNHDIWDAYKRFVGQDTSQFIEEQVQDRHVKKLRKLVSKNANNGTGTGSGGGANASQQGLILPVPNVAG